MKPWLKWTLRVVLTAAALYVVFLHVSSASLTSLVKTLQLVWLLPALVLFNLSQAVSARRLLYFYHRAGAPVSRARNLLLYYQGMFYNLFLPGGIGGDGYKIHFLHKRYAVSVKQLVTASVLDRLTGLAVLGLLGTGLACWLIPQTLAGAPAAALLVAIAAMTALGLWLIRHYLKRYFPVLGPATLLSVAVQLLQLAAAACLVAALGAPAHTASYLLLFLASSVAAAIPFTIGGAGAREIVFVTGAPLLGIVPEKAVAVSLLFFLITAASALPGVLLTAGREHHTAG